MLFPKLLNSLSFAGASSAPVTGGTEGFVNASGGGEFRDLPLFAPYGVCGVPCEEVNALILPLDGGGACMGVLCDTAGLRAGELRLFSKGGASILLRNNGDVVINGLTIRADGQLVPKEGTA